MITRKFYSLSLASWLVVAAIFIAGGVTIQTGAKRFVVWSQITDCYTGDLLKDPAYFDLVLNEQYLILNQIKRFPTAKNGGLATFSHIPRGLATFSHIPRCILMSPFMIAGLMLRASPHLLFSYFVLLSLILISLILFRVSQIKFLTNEKYFWGYFFALTLLSLFMSGRGIFLLLSMSFFLWWSHMQLQQSYSNWLSGITLIFILISASVSTGGLGVMFIMLFLSFFQWPNYLSVNTRFKRLLGMILFFAFPWWLFGVIKNISFFYSNSLVQTVVALLNHGFGQYAPNQVWLIGAIIIFLAIITFLLKLLRLDILTLSFIIGLCASAFGLTTAILFVPPCLVIVAGLLEDFSMFAHKR